MNEHEDVNDRAWWSRLYNLDDELKIDFIVDTYRAGEITDYQLWEALSSYHGPVSSAQAHVIYSKLGYVPFAGYPLERIMSKRGSP